MVVPVEAAGPVVVTSPVMLVREITGMVVVVVVVKVQHQDWTGI